MRIVHMHEGKLEIRWTWLPYWLAQNPKLKTEVERRLRDVVLVNGMSTSEEDLDALHRHCIKLFLQSFPFVGLDKYLDAMRLVEEG